MSFAPVAHTPNLVFSWSSFKGSFTVQQVPWVGGPWIGYNKWKLEALLLRNERHLCIGIYWGAAWWKSCHCSFSVNIFWLFASSLLSFVWHVKYVCVCAYIFKLFNAVRLEINIQPWNCHHLQVHKHTSFLHISSLTLFLSIIYIYLYTLTYIHICLCLSILKGNLNLKTIFISNT